MHLAWNEADTGNAPIIKYKILRGTSSGGEKLLTALKGSQTKYDDTTATDPTKTYYYQVVAINKVGQSRAMEVAAPYVGNACDGMIIHRNDPSHPEAYAGAILTSAGDTAPPTPPVVASAVPQLIIDYISLAEPASAPGYFVFKMKVENLSTVPPNSRWRIAWDWWTSSTQLYYVGMKSDANSNVGFEYGTLADAGVPAVLVLGETKLADLPQSPTGTRYDPDGTITMYVTKSGVGNPQRGDLLGAIGGKTITGDIPGVTDNLERSTTFVDHTFVKGNSDNSYPAATYRVTGNSTCGQP